MTTAHSLEKTYGADHRDLQRSLTCKADKPSSGFMPNTRHIASKIFLSIFLAPRLRLAGRILSHFVKH